MARVPTTKNGYNMYDMSSMLQKAIRRSDIPYASYAARELYFGFRPMMWNRLLTISAEECLGIITREIATLNQADSIMEWQGFCRKVVFDLHRKSHHTFVRGSQEQRC